MISPEKSFIDCEIGFKSPLIYDHVLIVKGMTCGACSSCIESTLKSNIPPDTLKSVKVDLLQQSVCVTGTGNLQLDQVVKLIKRSGFTVVGSSSDWRCRLEARKLSEKREYSEIKWRFYNIFILSIPVLFFSHNHSYKMLAFVFSIPLHFYAAIDVYKNAIRINGMERLIAVNCAASLLYSLILREQHSMYDCAAYVLILYSTGKLLENIMKRSLNGGCDDLLISLPKTVKCDGVSVSVKDLKVGHAIDLYPGDLIPLDGEILEIKHPLFVNESTLTGEAMPKHKQLGDHVLAGTRIHCGSAKMTITRNEENSFISKLARGVFEPMLNEAKNEHDYANDLAKWFVPAILMISFVTFIIWMIIFTIGQAAPKDLIPEWRNTMKYPSTPLAASIYFSLTVLCIACPCALAVATPVAVLISKAVAVKSGFIIRDPNAFKVFPAINVILFDKTGTLTTGTPEIVFNSKTNEDWILAACKKVEEAVLQENEHPIARAIYDYCRKYEHSDLLVKKTEIINGHGVKAVIIHNQEEHVIELIKSSAINSSSSALIIDNEIIGEFSWIDELKPEALDVINFFKRLNFKIGIISGDSQSATERLSRSFLPGTFTYVLGDCLPEDKRRIVGDLKEQGFKLAMIGDGLNDSMAMSRADFSVSLDPGSNYSTANTLMITTLPKMLQCSRNLTRQIWFNLIWAGVYNLLAIPLATGMGIAIGIKPIGPEIGTALMMLSGTSILFTSLLLSY